MKSLNIKLRNDLVLSAEGLRRRLLRVVHEDLIEDAGNRTSTPARWMPVYFYISKLSRDDERPILDADHTNVFSSQAEFLNHHNRKNR